MKKIQTDFPVTSAQPQIVKNLRLYGSPVNPHVGRTAQNQPPITNYHIYSSKKIPTVRVRFKDSDDDKEMVINQSDFDPDRYVRLD